MKRHVRWMHILMAAAPVLLGLLLFAAVAHADRSVSLGYFTDLSFRRYLAQKVDTDGNGVLSEAERNYISYMDLTEYPNISALNGLELFPGLVQLNCNGCSLTGLVVTDHPGLKTVACQNNQLTQLDLSGCSNLLTLRCENNSLTRLDLSGSGSLKNLYCQNNQLEELILDPSSPLEYLMCGDNRLTSLEVPATVKDLRCAGNELHSITLDQCEWLTYLYKKGTRTTSSDGSRVTYSAMIATTGYQLTVDAGTLIIVGAGIVEQPKNAAVRPGQEARFRVRAEGTDLQYQWQIYFPPVFPNKGSWNNLSNPKYCLGADQPDLTVLQPDSFQGSAGCKFRCCINSNGIVVFTDEVTITLLTDVPERNSHLTVTQKATSVPADGSAYAAGESIYWLVTVKNDGDVLIKEIAVEDPLTGMSWAIDELDPGSYSEMETCYEVQEKDLSSGKVVHTVTVTAKDADGKTPEIGLETDEQPLAAPETALPFKDVPQNASYYDALAWAYGNEIVKGTDKTHFSPKDGCTRGQFCTMLWRLNGSPAVTEEMKANNPFTDVKPGKGHGTAILWCADRGIISGYKDADGTRYFHSGGRITRTNMIIMLYKMAKNTYGAGAVKAGYTGSPYKDIGSKNKNLVAFQWAYVKKISRPSNGLFEPQTNCLRWHLVFFLYRYNNVYHVK